MEKKCNKFYAETIDGLNILISIEGEMAIIEATKQIKECLMCSHLKGCNVKLEVIKFLDHNLK